MQRIATSRTSKRSLPTLTAALMRPPRGWSAGFQPDPDRQVSTWPFCRLERQISTRHPLSPRPIDVMIQPRNAFPQKEEVRMVEFKRSASVVWNGDSRTGNGTITTASGALVDVPYTYGTRFGDTPGTNPEELIAAAHAACYSMALASTLRRAGHLAERIETTATCVMTRDETTGVKIVAMRLRTRARVPDLDAAEFAKLAQEGEQHCPVSAVLRPGLTIELDAALL